MATKEEKEALKKLRDKAVPKPKNIEIVNCFWCNKQFKAKIEHPWEKTVLTCPRCGLDFWIMFDQKADKELQELADRINRGEFQSIDS